MPDARFFPAGTSLNETDIRNLPMVTSVINSGTVCIDRVEELLKADVHSLSFALESYREHTRQTKAGVVITRPEFQSDIPASSMGVLSSNPRVSYAYAARMLYPDLYDTVAQDRPEQPIARSAKIGSNVRLGRGVQIGKNVTIGDGSQIGDYTIIDDHCQIGANARIGRFNTISYSLIGDDFFCGDHNVMGCAGYAFEAIAQGFVRVPQLGLLNIGNGVCMNGYCSIDRGALHDTIINDQVQIESYCKISHNVCIGSRSILVANVIIAGSVNIGKNVQIAGKVGINGFVNIGDGAIIKACTLVTKNVPPGGVFFGMPGMQTSQFVAQQYALNKLVRNTKK